MTIKTADEYRSELTVIANNAVVAFNDYKRGKSALNALGIDTAPCYQLLGSVIMKGFVVYVEGVCLAVSKAYQGDTLENFTHSYLTFDGLCLPRTMRSSMNKQSDESIVSELLENFDFDTFVSELKRASATLEDKGKTAIAKSLISEFRLYSDRWYSVTPKRTARHISVDGAHHHTYSDYYHGDKSNYLILLRNITAVANELNIPALPHAFSELFEEIKNTSSGTMNSGTTFGCKSAVLIRVFNGHIRYSFTPEMMDAIVTYIKLYAPDESLCDIPLAA